MKILCIASLLFLVPVSLEAVDYCAGSHECGPGFYCTTDDGECLSPPCGGDFCPTVCNGTCKAISEAPTLAPQLALDEVFMTTSCPAGCPQFLWLRLIEGVEQRIAIGSTVDILLEEFNEDAGGLAPVLSLVKPLSSPDGTIESFSIGLPAIATNEYPSTRFFKATITYNLEPYVWLIKVRQLSAEHSPHAEASSLNPNDIELQEFFAAPEALPQPVAEGVQFPDLIANSSIATAAYTLSARGIISGYPDGTFGPLNHVNRAEAAKFLLNSRYDQLVVKPGVVNFPDVPQGAWFEPFVLFASNNGIINGYPDGTFKPADTVNTAEFLKMLALTFKLDLNLPTEYIDVTPDDWFAQYAGIAAYYNLFPKRPSYVLWPAMELTREEVAVAIHTLLMAIE